MLRRTTLPSLAGVRPRSDFWMAFSILGSIPGSQGWMRSVFGSGTETVATWFRGVSTL
jgi:hypothetical protein